MSEVVYLLKKREKEERMLARYVVLKKGKRNIIQKNVVDAPDFRNCLTIQKFQQKFQIWHHIENNHLN